MSPRPARFALILGLLGATPTLAAPYCTTQGVETIFHCSFGSRTVTVCDMADGRFRYAYGKPGKTPELDLMRSKGQVTYTPWNGMGSSVWAALRFDNEAYGYEVGFSTEKREDAVPTGWLSITKNGTEIAFKDCRAGTVETALEALWDRF